MFEKNWSICNFFKSFLIAPAVAVLVGREEIIDCAQSAMLERISGLTAGVDGADKVEIVGGHWMQLNRGT